MPTIQPNTEGKSKLGISFRAEFEFSKTLDRCTKVLQGKNDSDTIRKALELIASIPDQDGPEALHNTAAKPSITTFHFANKEVYSLMSERALSCRTLRIIAPTIGVLPSSSLLSAIVERLATRRPTVMIVPWDFKRSGQMVRTFADILGALVNQNATEVGLPKEERSYFYLGGVTQQIHPFIVIMDDLIYQFLFKAHFGDAILLHSNKTFDLKHIPPSANAATSFDGISMYFEELYQTSVPIDSIFRTAKLNTR